MLKNIPPILSPELLAILCKMGHGDEIVLGDANFPHETMASMHCVRLDGHHCSDILNAILTLFPLDSTCPQAVQVMKPDDGSVPLIWKKYQSIIDQHDDNIIFKKLERHDFYKQSRKAYCIIATGEPALYANIILKKGCVICDKY